MTYREAIDRLYALKRHAIEPGTERTAGLLAHLDDPHRSYDAVQIAGTNGKGSTASMLAETLSRHGLRVGLYTSPHLDSVRERIRVDGRPIARGAITRFVDAVGDELDAACAAGRGHTFFEAVTAMALWHFAEAAVDVAVLEVGIGGRHDATSVVDPVATAVTSVGLDHTSVLGDTIEEIAADKTAIARGDVPLVTAAAGRSRTAVLGERADATVVGTDADADVAVDYGGIDDRLEARIDITGHDWSVSTTTPLLGERQAVNAGIAAVLARSVWEVDSTTIAEGIRGVSYPGRGELVQHDPLVLLDGAHNPPAAAHLADTVDELGAPVVHLVVGVMADKDLSAIAAALPPAASVASCAPATQRAEAPSAVASALEQADYDTVEIHRTVDGAVAAALDRAGDDDLVCVTGSLYTVAEARRRWVRSPAVGRVETVDGAARAMARAEVTDPGIARMRHKGVHRTVHLRVTHTQAAYLKQELLSAGGECAVSGVSADGELVDVLLLGTLAQFRRVLRSLEGQTRGLAAIGEDIAAALGLNRQLASGDWPWVTDPPAVMGIVNVTPDSFYDGGEVTDHEAAIERARAHVEAGADIIDIGGESTRPGGDPVPVDRECERVLPVVEAAADLDALVSIDTQKASVAADAIRAGADLVNDVSGLADPAMAPTVADHEVPIVVMHSIATPVEPNLPIEYDDIVTDVRYELAELVRRCERAGIDRSDVIVDPGLGFNKSPAENFELVGRVGELRSLGCPVLIGHSQKSMFGGIGYDPGERDAATTATSAIAAARGADILRVHHVEPTVAAIRSAAALTRTD